MVSNARVLNPSMIEVISGQVDRYQADNNCTEMESIIQIQILLVRMVKNRRIKNLPINWNELCDCLTYLHLRLLSFDRDKLLAERIKERSFSNSDLSTAESLAACLVNLRFGSLTPKIESSYFENFLLNEVLPDLWIQSWSFFNLPDKTVPDEIVPF